MRLFIYLSICCFLFCNPLYWYGNRSETVQACQREIEAAGLSTCGKLRRPSLINFNNTMNQYWFLGVWLWGLSWYQIETDSAASSVSCKSYLASTDSETFVAVITFHSCKTRSCSISDRRTGLIKLYIHESISSNWPGLYFILSNTHVPLLFLSFFNAVLFRFQTQSELEWFQEGSRPALQTASIVREMWRLEDERDAEKLSFHLCLRKYQKYGWEGSE